ncbi:MAG: hypothetical protein KAX31_06745, partial [Thermoplasmata archaeon]|nr:hypothetical protein [Thermoplasmata archaeon]
MKTVKVLFIVGMLVISGLFILPASNSGVASTPDVDAIGSDIIETISEEVPDAELLEETAQGEIPWSELPRDRMTSAKLFLEHRKVAIDFELPEISIEQTEEGEMITFAGCDFLMEKGMPLVPESRFFVAVPDRSRVTKVEVIEETVRQLDGRHMLAPYIPRTLDEKESPMQDVSYHSADMFPSNTFDIKAPQKLRHINALEIVVHPVRVRPASGIIQVTDSLRLSVALESDDGRRMTSPSVPTGDRLDSALLNSLFANPGDVRFYAPDPQPRAPSSINHTLGFAVSPGSIHPVKDTTVGNPGVALLEKDDSQYYNAEAGATMYVDGFDIGGADPTASLAHAVLQVQYVGPDGYNGSSVVCWALEGDALQDTTIQPANLSGAESVETYDLLGHANSPVTVSDLIDLDIEFTENGTGSGSKDIPFDYIWIEFAYRKELTGGSDYLIITSLNMADELTPLAEWKTERLGIDTQVYDTAWIDANWDGANLKERIHDFSVSMYENYSIEWILLAGDENAIPPDSNYYDNYHANMNLGLYPEVAIGRLCTDNESNIEGMVEDILAHQRDMRPWKKNMYLIGTNVFNTGDGKNDLKYVKDNYLGGHDLTFWEDYEVEGNVSRARTVNTYNTGMGNSIITGHGSTWGWYMNNGTQNFFNKLDVKYDMTNDDNRGFVWSSTCSSGNFLGGTDCIGERWLTARNGGGIGYIGACDLALYSSTKWLYRGFYRAYDQMLDAGNEPTQGGCHFQAMNSNFYGIYVLFGDPQAGLTIMDPEMNLSTGIFSPGFVEQKGFDQGEQVTFN